MNAVAKPHSPAFDPMLVASLVALLAIGAIMVGSASISIADRQMGEPLFYLTRHVAAIGIGVVGMLVAALVPTELWYRMNWLLLVIAFGLLAIVLIPGLGHAVN